MNTRTNERMNGRDERMVRLDNGGRELLVGTAVAPIFASCRCVNVANEGSLNKLRIMMMLTAFPLLFADFCPLRFGASHCSAPSSVHRPFGSHAANPKETSVVAQFFEG